MPYAVVTRDPETVAPYAATLGASGWQVVAMPVTRIEPPSDTRALSRALARRMHDAIVVASARAARELVRELVDVARGEGGGDTEQTGRVRPRCDVWAVGPATARVLEDAGIPAIVPIGARDGESLARAMILEEDVRELRVLVPRAEGGRDEIVDILRAAGALVDDVIAYRSVIVAHDAPELQAGLALLDDVVNVCIAFAPSQVVALDAIVAAVHAMSRPLPEMVPRRGDGLALVRARFAAIGDTTANALRELGIAPIAVAESPTPEGIAKALAAVYPRSL